jgi:hypothetical protein
MALASNAPSGPIETRWTRHKADLKLISPTNRRKFSVIVVGTGLAGASAAATLAELGYKVKAFCFHDSPAPGALDRRPGRASTPPRTTRTTATACTGCSTTPSRAVTSGPGSRTSSTRRGQREHHRPVRGPGRPLRSRIRGAPRQPLLWRGAGLADVLRPRPDRPAAAPRGLPGSRTGGRGWDTSRCTTAREMLDVMVVDGRARGSSPGTS